MTAPRNKLKDSGLGRGFGELPKGKKDVAGTGNKATVLPRGRGIDGGGGFWGPPPGRWSRALKGRGEVSVKATKKRGVGGPGDEFFGV